MAARSAAIGDALRSWQAACASLQAPEPRCVTSEHCERPQRCAHWAHCRSEEDHRGELEAARYRLDLLGRDIAAELLAAQPYPHHFLWFETIGFAVPIWPGTRPYEVLPFMWTCDAQAAPGREVQRHQFVADASGDPRRAFAQSLLQALGDHGTIFAYNAGFDGRRQTLALQRLAQTLQGKAG